MDIDYYVVYEKAKKIAENAHAGQKRKDGLEYITHPIAVASLLKDMKLKAIAMLHDVLEDTNYTDSDLREEGMPENVIEVVKMLTRKEGEKYSFYIMRCNQNVDARKVKLADLQHNLSNLEPGNLRRIYVMARRYLLSSWRDV